MAKTETTVKSYYYTVTSPNGGTVTDGSGKLNKTVEAGDQVTVQAPSDTLTCSDDDAVIYKANFKQAALALGLLGGGKNDLPAGYTRVEFLSSDGSASVELPFESKNKSFVCEHTLGTPKATSGLYVYGGTAVSDGYGIRYYADRQGLAFKGQDRIGNGTFLRGEKYKLLWKVTRNEEGKFIFGLEYNGATLSELQHGFNQYWHNVYYVFGSTNYNARIGGAAYELKISIEGKRIYHAVPALAPNGEPCMYDLVSRKPFRNAGSGQFIVGLTLSQAAQLGRKLPSTGGTLTVSLPEGYEQSERVAESLAEAEAKGWVLTIQTYAAETAAATYSLRRVWVRRELCEHGSYVAADGSRWQVEWCVDVIGADPEGLGYERFRGVEAAVAYWELEPYEYPEEIAD